MRNILNNFYSGIILVLYEKKNKQEQEHNRIARLYKLKINQKLSFSSHK